MGAVAQASVKPMLCKLPCSGAVASMLRTMANRDEKLWQTKLSTHIVHLSQRSLRYEGRMNSILLWVSVPETLNKDGI